MIKVSVVIPVYGVEKYIDQLLESIRKQKLQEIEVIFVDDGSPDRCPQILDEFVKTDDRYRVIHQKNGGVSVARNTGLAQATGEYVYIIDSDDWLADDALENLWKTAQDTNADLIYGDWYQEINSKSVYRSMCKNSFCTEDPKTIEMLQCAVHNKGLMAHMYRPEFDMLRQGGAPWRVMIRRALIEDNNLRFDPYVKGLGDDILYTLHLYQYVKKVAYMQKPIYHYRIVEQSYSHGYKAALLTNYSLIFERMEQFLRENQKNAKHWNAYYLGVMFYIRQAMVRYFMNEQNPKTDKERYAEFVTLMKKKPYCDALKKAPIAVLDDKKTKLEFLICKLRFFRIYWLYKKRGSCNK